MIPTRKKKVHNNYVKFVQRLKNATGYNLIARSKIPATTNNSFFLPNNKGFTPNNAQPPSKKAKKNNE